LTRHFLPTRGTLPAPALRLPPKPGPVDESVHFQFRQDFQDALSIHPKAQAEHGCPDARVPPNGLKHGLRSGSGWPHLRAGATFDYPEDIADYGAFALKFGQTFAELTRESGNDRGPR
jgi:hypothetical protein